MAGFIFIPFFAKSLTVLCVGEILQGTCWGVFQVSEVDTGLVITEKLTLVRFVQTLTTAYASEVCPIPLRGVLTTYVNLCWVSEASDIICSPFQYSHG